MVDVCLISVRSPQPSSALSDRYTAQPPLGIAYIAAVLMQRGISVEAIDMNLRCLSIPYVTNLIKVKKPKIVGLSALTESSFNAIRLSRIIKAIDEKIIIVVGGPHFSFLDDVALKNPTIDFVVRNEGEYTFLELSQSILDSGTKIENILGISYKKSSEIIRNHPRSLIRDLDQLPFPARNLYFLEEYQIPAGIISSRGCPNQCVFCSAGAFSGGRYRMRSAHNVFEEIKFLYNLGYKFFFFQDDTLTADTERLNELLNLLSASGMRIAWLCESRVDIENEKLFRQMAATGCIGVQFGVESGSQTILDKVNKNIILDQVRQSISWAAMSGITPICSFIIGHWYDTETTIEETIRFAIELQNEFLCQSLFAICTPLPGTRLYKYAEDYGCHILHHDYDKYDMLTPVMETKFLSAQQIRNYYFKALTTLLKHSPKELSTLLTLRKSVPEFISRAYDYEDYLI